MELLLAVLLEWYYGAGYHWRLWAVSWRAKHGDAEKADRLRMWSTGERIKRRRRERVARSVEQSVEQVRKKATNPLMFLAMVASSRETHLRSFPEAEIAEDDVEQVF